MSNPAARRLSAFFLAPTLFLTLALTLVAGGLRSQSSSFVHPDGTTHWYVAVPSSTGVTWDEANRIAASLGATLASIESDAERDVVFALVDEARYWTQGPTASLGPWIGGVQRSTTAEPAGGWAWSEHRAMVYTAWDTGQPDNANGADRACFGAASGRQATWHDVAGSTKLAGFVVEYAGPFAPPTVGLLLDDAEATPLYTLISPLTSTSSYLIDGRGRVVNEWRSDFFPGASSYLLDNGHLLRTGRAFNLDFQGFGGDGGIVEDFDFAGQKTWEFRYSSPTFVLHHDIARLPNGNVLMLAWEKVTQQDAIAAGRDPATIAQGELWPDKIIEVKPTGPTTGDIVWEWRAWDHLVQDFDSTKPNYGSVAARPERIDVNYNIAGVADWMHSNSIAYNERLDQIMISVRSFDEIWILDHSTTTAQAATSSGGRSGKGGDLLYRWGNPRAYKAGTLADQKLFKQHDAHWIADGLPGAGNVLVFNNGLARPSGNASSVDELVLPVVDNSGKYPRSGATWGPVAPAWSWSATVPTSFYSAFVSGAQRLPNGNTRICGGWLGLCFEVAQNGRRVWGYNNPIALGQAMHQGDVAANNWLFRAPAFAADDSALRGRTLTPREPLERHESVLLVDGSTRPLLTSLGASATFDLRAKDLPGRFYLLLTSATPGFEAIDTRFMHMAWDDVCLMAATAVAPTIFVDYFGTLDANGRAKARFALPQIPALVGATFYNSFLVFDFEAPTNLGLVSNAVTLRVKL